MFKVFIDSDFQFESISENDTERYAEFFTRENKDVLYLVRVEGQTGGSNCLYETHWDVAIFENKEQAEDFANEIDFLYDVYELFDGAIYFNEYRLEQFKKHHNKEYQSRLDEIFNTVKQLENDDQRIGKKSRDYIKEITRDLSYEMCGEQFKVYFAWYGHFEKLHNVDVLEIRNKDTFDPNRYIRRKR